MNKLFVKESERNYFSNKGKFKIAVYGLSQSAGASLIAATLAFLLSKNVDKKLVTYVEMKRQPDGKALLFNRLNFSNKFKPFKFYNYFEELEKGFISKKKLNLYKGVNWAVHVKNQGEAGFEEPIDILDYLPGSIMIADNPKVEDLDKFNLVVAVINPLPADLAAGIDSLKVLKKFEEDDMQVVWIINFVDKFIPLKRVEHFFNLKDYMVLPTFDFSIKSRGEYGNFFVPELIMMEKGEECNDFMANLEDLTDFILKVYEEW